MVNELADTTILIVDNPQEIRNIREFLREKGFNRLSDSSSALSVLTEIKKNPPQVVIANCNMPRYSGVQLFKSIVNDRQLASIKFIMTTPKLNRREREEMEKDGVTNIVERPFDEEALASAIMGAFGFSTDHMAGALAELAGQAQEVFDAGNFEEALKLFKTAYGSEAKSEYTFMMGRCYLEMALYDHAISSFQSTKAKESRFPDIDKWIAEAQGRKDAPENHLDALEKAASYESAGPQANLALGRGFLGANEAEKADKAFNRAIELAPDDSGVRMAVGNAYLDSGDYVRAEGAFGKAIYLNPEDIDLYNRMAIALRKQGKYKDAIAIYVKALNVKPKDEGLYYNLARALHESGDKPKAVKALDKALKIDPQFAEAVELREQYISPDQPSVS